MLFFPPLLFKGYSRFKVVLVNLLLNKMEVGFVQDLFHVATVMDASISRILREMPAYNEGDFILECSNQEWPHTFACLFLLSIKCYFELYFCYLFVYTNNCVELVLIWITPLIRSPAGG